MENKRPTERTSESNWQEPWAKTLRVKVTRRGFIAGIGLVGASLLLGGCSQAPNGSQSATSSTASSAASSAASQAFPLLAIIHTNDTHGHDVEATADGDDPGNFSMAAVAALKSDWKAKGYEVILVDAGDATQGMPLVDTKDGAPAMTFMNSCGYDLMAVGNHEFDWGADALAANEAQAKFPFLSANIIRKDTGEPRFATNKVVKLADGTKVGFFGLTTPATLTSTNPAHLTGLEFLQGDDLFACAQKQVDDLRDQDCDLVICVGHLGNDETGRESTSKAVLNNVKGIDLFIDGHDHEEVEEEVAGTLLVETGCYLHNIGVVAIDGGVPASDLVAYGSYEGIDASTQATIDSENKRLESEMGDTLAHTSFILDGEREHVRASETNLGDIVTDAFKWTAGKELGHEVDAGIVNSGALRDSLEAGDITMGDVRTVMPFTNDLAVIEVTGSQLLEALEAACQGIGAGGLIGGFPQVSGITFKLDASVPYKEGPVYPDTTIASPAAIGARVTISDVGGRGFDESETYSVAATSFLCAGGDTYHVFKDAAQAKAPVTFGFDYEAFMSYLTDACDHEVPDEYAKAQGRINIVGLS